MLLDPFITRLASCLIACLFLLAAVHKALNLEGFKDVIESYDVLTGRFIGTAAIAVILMEVAIVIGAFAMPSIALYAAASVLIGYAFLIAFNIMRGNANIDCGCSWGVSETEDRLSWNLVARNIGLTSVALIGLLPSRIRPFEMLDYINLGFAVIALIIGVFAASELSRVWKRMKAYAHV